MVDQAWRSLPLGEVITLQRGYDLSQRLRKPGDVPVVSSSGRIDTHYERRVAGPGVVIGRYGTIGEVFFIAEDFWPLNTTLYVRDFKGNDPLYISFLLRTLDYQTYSGKSGVPGVNRNDLHEIVVDLPPLSQQRAIGAALSEVEVLEDSLNRVIAKKRDLKLGAMRELLMGKTRLPGFGDDYSATVEQESRDGFPFDWVSTTLSSLSAFITKGATPTTYGFGWTNDGVLFLRSECVAEQGLDLTQSMYISHQANDALGRSEVRAGDILLTITGNVGRVVRLPSDFGIANINQHIARIRITAGSVSSDYIYHYLSQARMRAFYGSITTGQAYPQISLKQVRDTVVYLPPSKVEQQAIGSILSDMDVDIDVLEQRLEKTRALKQGMMQELLSGRRRLV